MGFSCEIKMSESHLSVWSITLPFENKTIYNLQKKNKKTQKTSKLVYGKMKWEIKNKQKIPLLVWKQENKEKDKKHKNNTVEINTSIIIIKINGAFSLF